MSKFFLRILMMAMLCVAISGVQVFAEEYDANNMSISGTHKIENNEDIKTGTHTFVLTAEKGAPMPDGAKNGVKEVSTSSNGSFDFGRMQFSKPGTYEYKVTRKTIPSDTLKQDDSEYTVAITVFSDNTASMVVKKKGNEGKLPKIEYVDEYSKFCTITYHLMGGILNGSGEDIVEKHMIGEHITIIDGPDKDGYEFQYWQGSKYYAGEEYVVKGDHEFTAIYEPIKAEDEPTKAEDEPTTARRDSGDEPRSVSADEPESYSPDGPKEDVNSRVVKTGDEFKAIIPVSLLIISMIALMVILKRKRDE